MFAPRYFYGFLSTVILCAVCAAPSFAHEPPPPCGLMGDGTITDVVPARAQSMMADAAPVTPEVQIKKIHSTGPDRSRLVLAFVSEGYTGEQLARGEFRSAVNDIVDFMRQTAPWSKFLASTNIYAVEIASDVSGISHPMQSLWRNTYLEASYGTGSLERLITLSYAGEARLNEILSGLLGDVNWHAAVVVNDLQYGGSGGRYAVSALDQLPQVMVHELGHSIFGLADEYGGAASHFHGELAPPNVDTALPPKWNRWITKDTEMPTSPILGSFVDGSIELNDKVGAFEGGVGYDFGVYHPSVSCMMGNLTSFCPVCREAMVRAFFDETPMADRIVAAKKKASLRVANFPDLKVTWKLCGKGVRGQHQANKASIKIPKRKANCSIEATVKYTGDWVRGRAVSHTRKAR